MSNYKVTYKLNPVFFVLVAFFSLVGYLVNDVRGAVWGAVIFFSISFAVSIIDFFVNINKSQHEKDIEELRRYFRK